MNPPVNISQLRENARTIPGDKIIAETSPEGIVLYDTANLFIVEDQVEFKDELNSALEEATDLISLVEDSLEQIKTNAFTESFLTDVAQLFDTTSITSTGTPGTSAFKEIVTASDPFYGPDVIIPAPQVAINNIEDLLAAQESILEGDDSCGVCADIAEKGTICISPGTYRIIASVCLSPEIDLNISDNDRFSTVIDLSNTVPGEIEPAELPTRVVREVVTGQKIWAYMSFKQLTFPERYILNGSPSMTFNRTGASITLNLNGYFYTDTLREYAITVSTIGKLYTGATTATFAEELNIYESVGTKFTKIHFRPVNFMLEKISNDNILSPTEASYPFPKKPTFPYPEGNILMYRAGWIRKLFTVPDTLSTPTAEDSKIDSMPFFNSQILGGIIGSQLAYITEPNSNKGVMKIGDALKYRSQLPDENARIPINNLSYDIRAVGFKTPERGWYGLLLETSKKTIGDVYDIVIRIDGNGIITSRFNFIDLNV